MNRSKEKGKRAEREITKILTERTGEIFIRNVTSGAYTGGKNKDRKITDYQKHMVEGDIVPPEWLKDVVLEVKNHKDFSMESLIFGKFEKIRKWISQHKGKDIILFSKMNRKGWIVLFDKKRLPAEDPPEVFVCLKYGGKEYIITNLDYFVENFDLILKRKGG